MGTGRQLRLLLWKNWQLQRQQPKGLLVQILLPTVYFGLLAAMRQLVTDDEIAASSAASYEAGLGDAPVKYTGAEFNWVTQPYSQQRNNFELWRNGNGRNYSRIVWAPDSAQNEVMMGTCKLQLFGEQLKKRSDYTSMIWEGFATEADLPLRDDDVLAAIVLKDDDGSGGKADTLHDVSPCPSLGAGCAPKVHIEIRMSPSIAYTQDGSGWGTSRAKPEWPSAGPRRDQQVGPYLNYEANAFLVLQDAMIKCLAQDHHPFPLRFPPVATRTKQMPHPEWTDTTFLNIAKSTVGTFLVLTYLYTAQSTVRAVVEEKEKRLKEAMKMMGLASWVHWVAWWLKVFLVMMPSIVALTIICVAGGLFPDTSPGLLLIFFMLYATSTIGMAFFLSGLFSSASVASAASGILFFMSYAPYYIIDVSWETVTASEQGAACLLSTTCAGFGIRIITEAEIAGQALTFSNVADTVGEGSTITMQAVLLMLLCDSILYVLLAVYLEAVLPGQYGVARPPWYFLQRSFWRGEGSGLGSKGGVERVSPAAERKVITEPDPTGLETGVVIKGLKKVFATGGITKAAVDGIDLKMYKGQVTVLLGHNGAGKTTTMSMMVGLFAPTAGSITIDGASIQDNPTAARRSLGLCPQFDVLFGTLSVAQNLTFFGSLKGLTGDALRAEVDAFIAELDLVPKRDSPSKVLSGGQRRALSVAVALIGGSKTVILDEPTSGMDPEKRRHTWDLIEKHKRTRTILLTTHFMDEADLLGDRIAIMAEGRVRCMGSSQFLKRTYGVGMHLTAVKSSHGCSSKQVLDFLQSYIPASTIEGDLGAELTALLPKAPALTMSALVAALENSQAELGLDSFGISVTTMEEVFIAAGNDATQADGSRVERRQSADELGAKHAAVAEAGGALRRQPMSGKSDSSPSLAWRQLRAMFVKRLLHSKRHLRVLFVQALLPVVFTIAAMAISGISISDTAPCRSLDGLRAVAGGAPASVLVSSLDSAGDGFWPESSNSDAQRDAWNSAAASRSNRTVAVGGQQETLGTTAVAYVNAFAGVTAADASDTNLTESLLAAGANFATDSFYYNSPIALSVEQSFWWLEAPGDGTGQCFMKRGPGSFSLPSPFFSPEPITLVEGSVHVFKLVDFEADFTTIRFDVSTSVNSRISPSTSLEENGDGQLRFWRWTVPAGGPYYYFCRTDQTTGTSITVTTDEGTATEPPESTMYAWYSPQLIHSAAEAVNAAGNVIARQWLGAGSSPEFTTWNCPLPLSASAAFDELGQDTTGLFVSIFLIFAFAFMCASFSLFVVQERLSLAKHVQMVSGAGPIVYWLGAYCWDLLNMTASNLLVLVVFAAWGTDAYTSGGALGTVFMVLEFFAIGILPLVYVASFRVRRRHPGPNPARATLTQCAHGKAKTPASGFAQLCSLLIFLTFVPLLTVAIMSQIDGYTDTARTIKYCFFVNPLYACVSAFYDMFQNQLFKQGCTTDVAVAAQCANNSIVYVDNTLSWEDQLEGGGGVGRSVLALFLCGAGYFAILMWVEIHGGRLRGGAAEQTQADNSAESALDEDIDVAAERAAVESGARNGDSVVVRNLHKVFGSGSRRKVAVDGLTFSIESGCCFGLLGVNGAGKSTTFKMLTGETVPSSGTAQLLGMQLATELRAVRQHIGYCPQFGGLIETLTGREHLRIFARLRGLPEEEIPGVVAALLQDLDFAVHADKPCGTYSGGNKRKLSTAIALVGDPDVVFLDEPTTGMDPTTRRYLWGVLIRVLQQGRSIVLTSHSMEECEALCTRLAIMVDGKFRCIGPPQHLKHRFGDGIQLMTRLAANATQADADKLVSEILAAFPGARTLERHGPMAVHHIPPGVPWSAVFEFIAALGSRLPLEDYSCSQPSLEQIFLQMARGTAPPDESIGQAGSGTNRGSYISTASSLDSYQAAADYAKLATGEPRLARHGSKAGERKEMLSTMLDDVSERQQQRRGSALPGYPGAPPAFEDEFDTVRDPATLRSRDAGDEEEFDRVVDPPVVVMASTML